MSLKTKLYYSSYSIIVIGLFISGYLLLHHYALVAGKPLETDLCSALFNKGCTAAAFSNLSVFMKIPVGGWGIIYLSVLGSYIFFSHILVEKEPDEIVQLAFWIAFIGNLFSLFYMVNMILHPVYFCPFCALFHILNFILFFLIKKISKKSLPELIRILVQGMGIVFLAKPISNKFNNWKWLAFLLPLVLSISIYQWSLMKGLNIRIDKLESYQPIAELEKFDNETLYDLNLLGDDAILGSLDAPVTLVVFSDFQCSLCKMFSTNFAPLVGYNKEKLNIIFKHFPLCSDCNPLVKNNLHPLSCQAAQAAEAARLQGKFWEYHDLLFETEIKNDSKVFFDVAQKLGLEMDKFKMDFESETTKDKINKDIEEGLRLKLDGTPSAFLNGKRIQVLNQNNINFLTKYLAK
jgi:protein-disulfide isomerase/uncharacterized membrane protein